MICPAETPEGGKIGIVKNLALLCNVSLDTPKKTKQGLINIMVQRLNLTQFEQDFDINRIKDQTKVFLNGNWIGFS